MEIPQRNIVFKLIKVISAKDREDKIDLDARQIRILSANREAH